MTARVLCVDDDPMLLEGLWGALGRHYDVVLATSGAEALSILSRDPAIAVAISDMTMPGMTGAQWLAVAHESGHEAVGILLTGHADLDAASEAVARGHVFRCLAKPCTRAELDGAIAAAVEQHRQIAAEVP